MSALERLNGELRGTGDRAMVFAHGFGCDQRMWRHVAPAFESEFVTVLIDHVGSGSSDLSAYSADKYSSLKGYAEDFVELGREVPLEDAVFVGHSCGAMIGLLASIQSPRLFDSLVLVSASPRYINDQHYSGGFSKKEVVNLLRRIRSDYDTWSEEMAPVFMGNPARPELTDELLKSFRQTNPTIAAAFAAAIFTSDWRKELSQVTADCLVVQSEKDPVVPVSVGEYLSSHIAGGRFETIAAEGHFPHLSAPKRVIQSIRQFVGLKPRKRSNGGSRGVTYLRSLPATTESERLFSTGSWSRRAKPLLADAEGREQLEELLLQRAGELFAQFGRYDMHAVAIENWLSPMPLTDDGADRRNLRTRGEHIKTLLQGKPDAVIREYGDIYRQITAVFLRHETAAKNAAVVPALGLSPIMRTAEPREWYEFDSASDQELLFFVDALERDILHVAALCVRLSNFAELTKNSQQS